MQLNNKLSRRGLKDKFRCYDNCIIFAIQVLNKVRDNRKLNRIS